MLVKCEDCGRDISDRAKACPHCGAPTCHMDKIVKVTSARFAHALGDLSKFIFRKAVPILVLSCVFLLGYWLMQLYKDRVATLATIDVCLAISNSLFGGLLFLFVVKWAWGDRAFKIVGWLDFALLSLSFVPLVAPAVNAGEWKLLMFMQVFAFLPLIAIFNWLRSMPSCKQEQIVNENHVAESKTQEVNKTIEIQGPDNDQRRNGKDVKNDDKKCLGFVLSILAVLIGIVIVFAAIQGESDRKLMEGNCLKYDVASGELRSSKPRMDNVILQDLDDAILSDICNYWRTLLPSDNSAISVNEKRDSKGQRINMTAFLFLDLMPNLDNKNSAYFKKTVDFCRRKIDGNEMEKDGVRRVYKTGAGLLVSCLADYRMIKVVLPKSIGVSEECFYEPAKRSEEEWQKLRRMINGKSRY